MLNTVQVFVTGILLNGLQVRSQDHLVAVDKFVEHGNKGQLQVIIPDEKHGAFILVLDVGCAAPCYIFSTDTAVNSALKTATAFAAEDFSGKSVSILVFSGTFDYTLFCSALGYNGSSRFKVLFADDGFMMICYHILILLPHVPMAIKSGIRVGFLEDRITGIFLIRQHSQNGS